jgi:phage-related protein
MAKKARKPCEWVASSLDDLREFPEDVKDEIGGALDPAGIWKRRRA